MFGIDQIYGLPATMIHEWMHMFNNRKSLQQVFIEWSADCRSQSSTRSSSDPTVPNMSCTASPDASGLRKRTVGAATKAVLLTHLIAPLSSYIHSTLLDLITVG